MNTTTTTTTTTTTARKLRVRYTPTYRAEVGWDSTTVLPESLWQSPDGRVLARYAAGRTHVYGSRRELRQVHPYERVDYDPSGETRDLDLPPLRETYSVEVDWAEIHAAADAIDRARRGTYLGRRDGWDAYGGSYCYTAYSDLAGLARLARGTGIIAEDAWGVVHQAGRDGDVDAARQACRVAIACSRLFRLLHRAGLISDPSSRICGTGEGYGLTGLRWLAGEEHDEGCSSAEVETFARGGQIPARTGAVLER